MVVIKTQKTGNWTCPNCGKTQPGMKMHPYTVWYKTEDEKRGHNLPVCSMECAKIVASKYI